MTDASSSSYQHGWIATEAFDELYELAVKRFDETHPIVFGNPSTGVYATPIPGGPDLRFLSHLKKSKRLCVVFHGAIRRDRDRYPRFDRVGSMQRAGESFVSFADPTLLASDDLTLGWYTGTQEWDPVPQICKVVDAALHASGARQLVFVGGSGGGFAALRISARYPGSCAFVFSPQTSTVRYGRDHFPKLLEAGYDTQDPELAYVNRPGILGGSIVWKG